MARRCGLKKKRRGEGDGAIVSATSRKRKRRTVVRKPVAYASGSLLHHLNDQTRGHLLRSIDALRRLAVVGFLRAPNVHERLRIAFNHREPRAVDLHQDLVAWAKRVAHVRQ